MTVQRYPLAWPTGWPRARRRERARFHSFRSVPSSSNPGHTWKRKELLSLSQALGRLEDEMGRLGVAKSDWLISSDLRLRLDGFPVANQAQPADVGVAVYFKLQGSDRVLACDTWDRMPDNIAAIAAHIECIRGIERYRVGTMEQAFSGYAALPAKGSTWRTSLGFEPGQVVTKADIERAFRDRARSVHPDVAGGSHDAMASLPEAKMEGLKEIGSL